MAETRFAYKPKTHVMLLAAVFFLVATAVLIYAGATNDRGLILNRIFEMDAQGATTFFYVLAGLSAAMTAGGVFGLVMSAREPKFVVLDDTGAEGLHEVMPMTAKSAARVTRRGRNFIGGETCHNPRVRRAGRGGFWRVKNGRIRGSTFGGGVARAWGCPACCFLWP
mgnify:CR=1 FL=1